MTPPVVIVGAGQAGQKAAECLRKLGMAGPIVMLGEETHPPYQRPPLSKRFLKGEIPPAQLSLASAAFFAQNQVELRLGARVSRIEPAEHRVILADGTSMPYAQALIATGSHPRALPFGSDPHVLTLRTIADVERIRARLDGRDRVAIVGGGYIGLEVAAVLRSLGRQVAIIEVQSRLLARVASEPISRYFLDLHRAQGVDIRLETRVLAIEVTGDTCAVSLDNGGPLEADMVLVSVGGRAADEVAVASGIAVDDGIVVDAQGRTSAPDVFAAGDCARFPSRRYGRTLRLESVQNANDHARAVAEAMCGVNVAYDPIPWFWSDQYDTKLQIVGLPGPDLAQSIEGDPASGRFSVVHSAGGRTVCVEAVNDPRRFMLARKQLALAE